MWFKHPRTQLIPYLRGELSGAERVRLDAHLQRCELCRHELGVLGRLMEKLSQAIPAPPIPMAASYRAGVRARLYESGRQRVRFGPLIPIALTAVMAVAIAAGDVDWRLYRAGAPAPGAQQEIAAGQPLDLLENYPLVEHLDLLENLDVIEHLDELAPQKPSNNGSGVKAAWDLVLSWGRDKGRGGCPGRT